MTEQHEFENEREMGRDILVLLLLAVMVAGHSFSDAPFPYLSWALFGSYLCAVFFRERAFRERERFLNQLKSHRSELRRGGTVVVDQSLVRYDTLLTTYVMTIGGIFSSVTVPSRYHHWTGEAPPQSLCFTVLSLLTGWWSPGGPAATIRGGIYNLRGGRIKTVAELIDRPLLARINRLEERYRREEEQERERREKEEKDESARIAERKKVFTGDGSRSGVELAKRGGPSSEAQLRPRKDEPPPGYLQQRLTRQLEPLRARLGAATARLESRPGGARAVRIARRLIRPSERARHARPSTRL